MQPPNEPNKELAAALVKGAVSAIPFVGGVISEVGNLYLNPLEKRKQRWLNEVGRAIEEIRDRLGLVSESLQADEGFISFLYDATILALKNHQEEKLKMLGNAIVSAADPQRVSDDLAFQFFRYIDELTVTHVQILAAIGNHGERIARLERLEDVYNEIRELTGLPLDRAMFRSFLNDLDLRFLVRVGDLDDFPEYASKISHMLLQESAKAHMEVTELGRQFLSFIG